MSLPPTFWACMHLIRASRVLATPCSSCPVSICYQFSRPACSVEYQDDSGPCEVSCLENRRVNAGLEHDSECVLLSLSCKDKLLLTLTDGDGEEHILSVNRCLSSNFHFCLQDGEATPRVISLTGTTIKMGGNMKQLCLALDNR